MLKYKIISLAIAAGILLNILPATLQAETMEEQLAKVTAKVKTQIEVDQSFTSFHGEVRNYGTEQYWNLIWLNENNDSLNITANNEGKILNYYRYYGQTEIRSYDGSFTPVFPEIDRDQAKTIAASFLNKVLGAKESFVLSPAGYTELRKGGSHYFSGVIYLNKLPSPITFDLSVDSGRKAVVSYQRSDSWRQFAGEVPGATPAVKQEQSAKLLKDTIKFRLEYVLDSTDDGKAVLRYLPINTGDFIVDAKTGQLVNIDELYKEINEIRAEDTYDQAVPGAALGKSALTEVELQGIEKLKDVLPKEAIDKKIRDMKELGLTDFSLAETKYYYDAVKDSYTCRLTYALKKVQEDDIKITRKYVIADGKTGELQSLATSYPYEEQKKIVKIRKEEAEKIARDFLAHYFSENYKKTDLYLPEAEAARFVLPVEQDVRSFYFQFAQKEKGYYFPENNYTVSVDGVTGKIDSFSGTFNDVEFQSPVGIISEKQAIDSYFGTFAVTLGYKSLPKKVDLAEPDLRPLIEQGITYLYELRLSYYLNAEAKPWAIDAKTGEPIYYTRQKNGPIVYEDADKLSEKIKTLARYGIGYPEKKFRPTDELTQVDLIALLLSADNYRFEPLTEDQYDELYARAYTLGILTKDQRSPGKKVDRLAIIKSILNMSGYGKSAVLKGIFTSSFKDFPDIPADGQGYAAIAQALGLVQRQTFDPQEIITRQEAAEIFYEFLNRK